MDTGKLKDKIFYSFVDWHLSGLPTAIKNQLCATISIEINNNLAFVRCDGKAFWCKLTSVGVKKNSWRNDS